ncbi:hypothetical protein BJY52DRAFT_1258796 [Lactarius psammicola]|nr:hypothetical protein BJY52DRAFT_1258796 [Lactarius psammicola]
MLSSGRNGRGWAANDSTAARLPAPLSRRSFIVYGGLAPSYLGLSSSPSTINDIGRSILHKLPVQHRVQPPPHPPHAYPRLPPSTTREEHALLEADGIIGGH